MNPGTPVKTKYGTARIIELMPKMHPKHEDRYVVKLNNPGRDFMGGYHFDAMGIKIIDEPGILYIFKSELKVLELKQGELF